MLIVHGKCKRPDKWALLVGKMCYNIKLPNLQTPPVREYQKVSKAEDVKEEEKRESA